MAKTTARPTGHTSGDNHRLFILKDKEVEALYRLPQFSDQEKAHYFTLEEEENSLLVLFRTAVSKIFFILQLGYFKARKKFFGSQLTLAQEDLGYLTRRYFPQLDLQPMEMTISKPTRLQGQAVILEITGYRLCKGKIRKAFQEKASSVAAIHTKPVFVIRELFHYLEGHKIVAPAYSVLQDIIGNVLEEHLFRMEKYADQFLSESHKQVLDDLLSQTDSLYALTLLKGEPKDFSLKEMLREIQYQPLLSNLYIKVKELVKALALSAENAKHYASLVDYYSVYKIKRMDTKTIRFLLCCFVYHRYQKLHDHLINAFIFTLSKYIKEAKAVAMERIYQLNADRSEHLKQAGQVLALFLDENIAENTPFEQVKARAFQLMEKAHLSALTGYLAKKTLDETAFQWEHYSQLAPQFKRSVRKFFLVIPFESTRLADTLLEAVDFLKENFGKQQSLRQIKEDKFPIGFIDERVKRHLYPNGTLDCDRYEFLVYRKVREQLESGDMYVSDSLNYKSFEQDLISAEKWANRDQLLQSLELPRLSQPIERILQELELQLNRSYRLVNERIKTRENEHIKIQEKAGKTQWTLPYQAADWEDKPGIFSQLPHLGFSELFSFVNETTHFSDAFTHLLGRFVKKEEDTKAIMAVIVACGTNMGLGKMAQNSDVDYQRMLSVFHNFVRPETLKEACDKVINALQQLSIFPFYHVDDLAIYSSSDGQKFETQLETINSRYSSKYFGLNKGVTSYTLNANHIPLNAKIIGANEHESHYVFDLLFNNSSEVDPSIHTTDSHGINEANFALLYFFGYQFAPRYRNLSSKAKLIYSFEAVSQYEDYLIKPIRSLNIGLIKDEWNNILRIMLSLATKTTSQAVIVRKLSSHARRNKTKQALWELNHIFKSLHILQYINDPGFRTNIQKALNRGEAFHRLKKAIFYANGGKFRVKSQVEQLVWSECTRLISLCIIYYNSYALSRIVERKNEQQENTEAVKRVSPIAWQHMDLYGKFQFGQTTSLVNMEEAIRKLSTMDLSAYTSDSNGL
ncbi:MAG: Tn3 family transposase [Bacteroidota bacterium]